AAPASSIIVTNFPSPTAAGSTHLFMVTALDAFGNVATTYTGSVALTTSDALGTLSPSMYTFTVGDAGVHTFSGTLRTAGTQSITATDSGNSLIATQNNILVTPAPASRLVVPGYPSPTAAGQTNPFTVTAKDAFGNTATNYTGTVTVT